MKKIIFLPILFLVSSCGIFNKHNNQNLGKGFGKEIIKPKEPEPEYKVATKILFDTTKNISQTIVQMWTASKITFIKQEKGNTAQVLTGGKIDLAKVEKND